MTDDEENLLADGKNFEHSGASVHTSKIELQFRTNLMIESQSEKLLAMNPGQFKNVYYNLLIFIQLFIYIHNLVFKGISLNLLRQEIVNNSAELASKLDSKGNFSRFHAMYTVMAKNKELCNLMNDD
jgi:hypothetical protein